MINVADRYRCLFRGLDSDLLSPKSFDLLREDGVEVQYRRSFLSVTADEIPKLDQILMDALKYKPEYQDAILSRYQRTQIYWVIKDGDRRIAGWHTVTECIFVFWEWSTSIILNAKNRFYGTHRHPTVKLFKGAYLLFQKGLFRSDLPNPFSNGTEFCTPCVIPTQGWFAIDEDYFDTDPELPKLQFTMDYSAIVDSRGNHFVDSQLLTLPVSWAFSGGMQKQVPFIGPVFAVPWSMDDFLLPDGKEWVV
jgi:hypothetical protein